MFRHQIASCLVSAALIGLGIARIVWRRRVAASGVFAFAALFVGIAATPAAAEPGLLLVAHGAPGREWNQPVMEFGDKVAKTIKKEGNYKAVRTAMMEFAKPDVPTAVAELEAEGCDRIVAIPLFLAPTGHTHFDLPAVLGIYTSPKTSATLAAEGAAAARPKVPIVLTQTLAESDVLDRYVLDEARKLSKKPRKEAVVLLVHGDPEHALLVERMMRRVATHCCGELGIGYGDWASIGVGQEYIANGLPAIQNALKCKERTISIGLYLSTTASQIHERGMKSLRNATHVHTTDISAENVVFSDSAVINHPSLFEWVLETARTVGKKG